LAAALAAAADHRQPVPAETYLDYFLAKLHKPITFYSVKMHEKPGIHVRPGYGDPEGQGPIFSPLSSWEVEPMREIVDELLIEGGVHVFAGLFEPYKSMFALELSASLLAGRPVAGHFESRKDMVEGVLYLCLDMPHGLFLSYARNFGLDKEPRFSASGPRSSAFVAIDDPGSGRRSRARSSLWTRYSTSPRFKTPSSRRSGWSSSARRGC
jgi:hypothetical protein